MKSKLNNKRLLAYIASVIVALLVLFGCQGCTRQIVKPEVKPEVSTPKQNTAKQYYNFKTVSQAETPLAIIAVIPENWPFDEENSLTYGVLNTELIQRGFHVVSLNNLYDLVETKYIQLGFYKNLNYKQMKEKLKIDAILVYQSSGTNIDKASFRLVDASTSEILLSSSFIVGDEVLDELCYKAIVSEIEKVYKSKHESYRNDFVKTENELVFNEFKTTYTPTSPNLSVVLMNSEWPYKSGLYTFEKQNLITAYLMSNKIKVYDENPLYYALFDKIVKYEFFNTVFFDSTHVLFGKLEDNKGHANFINKLNISEVSKYLNTEAVLLYYTEESKNKLNYNIVNLSDGKIIASSSANIPKIDKEEDLIKKMITDISQVIPAKKKTIKNNDYLLDSYFTYDGDIIDKDILVATKPIKIVEEKKSEISITKDIYEFKDVKTKPRLKGGMKELNNLVDMFRPKLIKGFANTEFIVDKQGKVKDIIILNSSEVNPILQEAAKLVSCHTC